jgi:hypothetical protein
VLLEANLLHTHCPHNTHHTRETNKQTNKPFPLYHTTVLHYMRRRQYNDGLLMKIGPYYTVPDRSGVLFLKKTAVFRGEKDHHEYVPLVSSLSLSLILLLAGVARSKQQAKYSRTSLLWFFLSLSPSLPPSSFGVDYDLFGKFLYHAQPIQKGRTPTTRTTSNKRSLTITLTVTIILWLLLCLPLANTTTFVVVVVVVVAVVSPCSRSKSYVHLVQ